MGIMKFGAKGKDSSMDGESDYLLPGVPYYEEYEVDSDEGEELEAEEVCGAETIVGQTEEEVCGGKEKNPHPRLGWGEWIALACITVVLAWFIQSSILQAFNVPSRSMEPALLVGDSVIVNKLAFGFYLPDGKNALLNFGAPKKGDVVVFVHDTKDENPHSFLHSDYYVKRIVAVPGDEVEVVGNRVRVNGVYLGDDTVFKASERVVGLASAARRDILELKSGQYYVLGDNRAHSEDSRMYGPISASSIIGKAVMVYWSRDTSDGSYRIRSDRLGAIIK